MNPFFFGDTGSALYGVHHPPRGSKARSSGVVLCYPFAQEYMRAGVKRSVDFAECDSKWKQQRRGDETD